MKPWGWVLLAVGLLGYILTARHNWPTGYSAEGEYFWALFVGLLNPMVWVGWPLGLYWLWRSGPTTPSSPFREEAKQEMQKPKQQVQPAAQAPGDIPAPVAWAVIIGLSVCTAIIVLLIALFAPAAPGEKGKIDDEKGKITTSMTFKEPQEEQQGTYTVNGDQLILGSKGPGDEERKTTMTIKELTDKKLVLEFVTAEDGKTATMELRRAG
jgi:hypothetical protein